MEKLFLKNVRERVSFYGIEGASIQDLLAVVVGKNNPEISYCLSSLSAQDLMQMTKEDFMEIEGIGEMIAERIKAAITLGRRITERTVVPELKVIRSPDDAHSFLTDLKWLQQEHFVALYLNTKNHVIKKKTVFVGSLNVSIVHPREIFAEAINCRAASIIVAHNHPSTDTQPSDEDIEVTKRLVEVGKIVGIEVIDHLIIGGDNYLSLKKKGYI